MKHRTIVISGIVAASLCLPALKSDAANMDIWMIGEFNEWKVPSETDNQGAIKLNITDSQNGIEQYEGMFYSGEVAPKIVYYYKNPSDGKYYFACGPGFPVSLYSDTNDRGTAYFSAYPILSEDLEFAKIIRLRLWMWKIITDNGIHIFTGSLNKMSLIWPVCYGALHLEEIH